MALTIRDIAKASGKSYPTVSRAMNNHPKISEKTKREIREIAERLGYRPSFAGAALSRGGTFIYSVIVPDLADPFYARFISDFKHVAQRSGFDIVVYDYERNTDLERRYLERMMSAPCDGVAAFITSFLHTHDIVERLWNARVPLVAIGTPHDFAGNARYDWCTVVPEPAFLTIMQHLKKQGKCHPATVIEPQPDEILSHLAERNGEMFQQAGMLFTRESFFVAEADGQNQAEDGFHVGMRILAEKPETDIILSRNSFQAYGLLAAARRCRRRVPEDLAIVVSDYTWVSQYSPVPFYCLDQHLDELADWSFQKLYFRTKHKDDWQEPQQFICSPSPIFPDGENLPESE